MIDQTVIDAINEIPMSEILDDFGIEQTQVGSVYTILCPSPDHDDTHVGNCVVYQNNIHCYACGYHAQSIKLVQDLTDLSFPAAVQWICDRHGIYCSGSADNAQTPAMCVLSSIALHAIGIDDLNAAKRLADEDRAGFFDIITVRAKAAIKQLRAIDAHTITTRVPDLSGGEQPVLEIITDRIKLLTGLLYEIRQARGRHDVTIHIS